MRVASVPNLFKIGTVVLEKKTKCQTFTVPTTTATTTNKGPYSIFYALCQVWNNLKETNKQFSFTQRSFQTRVFTRVSALHWIGCLASCAMLDFTASCLTQLLKRVWGTITEVTFRQCLVMSTP